MCWEQGILGEGREEVVGRGVQVGERGTVGRLRARGQGWIRSGGLGDCRQVERCGLGEIGHTIYSRNGV